MKTTDQLRREKYLNPLEEFGLDVDKLLKLRKPLYDFPDTEDYCHDTINHHLREELLMKPFSGDLSTYNKFTNHRKFEGVIGVYVDDLLAVGSKNFEIFSTVTQEKFYIEPREYPKFKFVGIKVKKSKLGIQQHHFSYESKLNKP